MEVDKDNPSSEWVAHLRERFPCEPEVDRVLTRKLQLRAGAGYTPTGLDELSRGLHSLLDAELDEPFEVSGVRWLSGGASKVQMYFELDWTSPEQGRTHTPMVLRMEPAAAIVETSGRREFQIVRAMAGEVPVPAVHWADPEGEHLPYPAMVYGFAPGVTKPSDNQGGISGVGTNYGPRLRESLGAQFVEHLAAIHHHDVDDERLTAIDKPASGAQAVEWQLNWWERVWEEDSGEEVPLMRLAAAWLRDNMPPVDRLCLVHGDYRVGNFLFDEDERRITALLDWELSHIGDRHEDLGWLTHPALGHRSEDGETFLNCGLMGLEQLLETYEDAAGLAVDRDALRFWEVFSAYKIVVITLGTGYRISRAGKTHQDVLVAWLLGLTPLLLECLRSRMELVV